MSSPGIYSKPHLSVLVCDLGMVRHGPAPSPTCPGSTVPSPHAQVGPLCFSDESGFFLPENLHLPSPLVPFPWSPLSSGLSVTSQRGEFSFRRCLCYLCWLPFSGRWPETFFLTARALAQSNCSVNILQPPGGDSPGEQHMAPVLSYQLIFFSQHVLVLL